jgi:tetratricopeptide (TPR) repeat protein
MKTKMREKEDRQKESRREIGQLIQKSFELMTSHPDECIELAGRAKELSEKAGDRIGLGYALMHIGLGYFHKDELAKALEYYKQAEDIFEAAHDVYGMRSVYNNIGVVYHQWRERDKALRYYQLNLDLEAQLPNPRLNASIMNNIATIHTWAREFDLPGSGSTSLSPLPDRPIISTVKLWHSIPWLTSVFWRTIWRRPRN